MLSFCMYMHIQAAEISSAKLDVPECSYIIYISNPNVIKTRVFKEHMSPVVALIIKCDYH